MTRIPATVEALEEAAASLTPRQRAEVLAGSLCQRLAALSPPRNQASRDLINAALIAAGVALETLQQAQVQPGDASFDVALADIRMACDALRLAERAGAYVHVASGLH